MEKPRILVQLDPDKHASSFDAVVAVDAPVQQLLQYHHVEPADVRNLVYGTIFTRSPAELKQTAIFIGGSEVAAGQRLLKEVTDTFFGPMRVSVMLDANGANTTASAAVLAAGRHVTLNEITALVLGGTGPVGQRVARLLARAGTQVRLASRQEQRAAEVCQAVGEVVPQAKVTPHQIDDEPSLRNALQGVQLVIAAGALGVTLLPEAPRRAARELQVAIDLNAVPPLGIAGIEPTDTAADREGVIAYGAIGVGGTKMKLHKAALQQLYTANNLVLDAEEIYEIGRQMEQGAARQAT